MMQLFMASRFLLEPCIINVICIHKRRTVSLHRKIVTTPSGLIVFIRKQSMGKKRSVLKGLL